MALFWTRGWVDTKGTHATNVTAGQDLLQWTLVKETAPDTHVFIEALNEEEAQGWVYSSKGALAGAQMDIILYEEFHKDLGGNVTPSGVHIDLGCPTVNDDATLSYIVGTEWYSTTRKAMWISLDDTPGAAVWQEISNFRFDTVDPTVTDDYANCFFPGFKWWNDTTQRFWLNVDATNGAAIWIDIGPGIADVVIGNTLHVDDVYGNDATAVPNSLVYKYLTIQAAFAASGLQDTIYIWPGSYTLPASLAINGTNASRFYAHIGVVIITPPIGSPAFNIDPGFRLSFLGYATWFVRSDIFWPTNPSAGINLIDFEADQCAQFGVQGFIGNITSMRGHIKINSATDLAIQCDGWCDIEMAINRNLFTGAALYNIANITSNNGLAFNASEGVSRFQLRGRDSKYAYIYGAYGPGFLFGVFNSGSGGGRDDRHVKICADVYAFDAAGFHINEGTWVWEGSGYADKEPLPINDVFPFFKFAVDNVDFYFEHRMGSVNSYLDNTICHMANNGTVKLAGNYYTLGDTFPLIKYDQSVSGNSRLILAGNFQTTGALHVMEFNDLSLGTGFLPVFSQATIYSVAEALCIDSTSGLPMNIYVEHSLVTNTTYNTVLFTDLSIGNRHYVDRMFTNYIPSEFLR